MRKFDPEAPNDENASTVAGLKLGLYCVGTAGCGFTIPYRGNVSPHYTIDLDLHAVPRFPNCAVVSLDLELNAVKPVDYGPCTKGLLLVARDLPSHRDTTISAVGAESLMRALRLLPLRYALHLLKE